MSGPTFFIGVVGQIASGKGVLVDYLIKKQGFTSFSLSSILHEELKTKKITKYTRKTLQDLGDELRTTFGREVLAKKAIETLKKKKIKKAVIEGIRNTGEVEYLKKIPEFVLIGVKSTRSIRFKRVIKRAKPWDPRDHSTFLVVDRRDLGIGQKKSGQQVGKCLDYCDYMLTNNRDIKDFERKVERLVKKIVKI